MVRIQAENFSLEQIWQSGQCFRLIQIESDYGEYIGRINPRDAYLCAASVSGTGRK